MKSYLVRLLFLGCMSLIMPNHSFAGVTAIKYWTNFTGETVTITNWERPGELMTIGPNNSSSKYQWWVPWVWSQQDVNNKSLEVRVGNNRAGCVFQGTNNDGQDRVRFSSSCTLEYTDNWTYVNGDILATIKPRAFGWGYSVDFVRN